MPAIDPKRYDQAIMQASILEAVMDTLDGKPVSDFMESFDEVWRARSFRQAIEGITAEHSNTRPGFAEVPIEWLATCSALLLPDSDQDTGKEPTHNNESI